MKKKYIIKKARKLLVEQINSHQTIVRNDMNNIETMSNMKGLSEVIPKDNDGYCTIYKMDCADGLGLMTVYQVFPGIQLIYNDFEATEYEWESILDKDILEINHCREGREGSRLLSGSCLYLGEGDLSIHTMDHCKVDIITEDTDYSAYLKGHESVSALHLREYMATKQDLINMTKLARIDAYYADSYEECEEPTADEVNAYLQDGNTLIISAVRNNRVTIEQRKEKIKWLIQLGADVNKRDCSRRYFPALSHAVQMKDYEMFMFLLLECKANPNVGSRNPFDAGKVRQKNEGNMPLMIAAWEGKKDFVIALCEDERTSINQQDANGFTALMKACMNGHFENNKEKHTWDIRKILIDAGADQKIVDIDGKTAADWVSEYHESGPTRKQFNRGNNTNSQKRGNRRW